jgi:alanine transaminase
MFPLDAVARAKELRAAIGGAGTGSYTNSQGVAAIRQDVADFITERDGHTANPDNIFLTNGASAGIQSVLTAAFASDKDALMIPIPQYPIYSALVALLGGQQVGYELDETAGWSVTEAELESRLAKARDAGLTVKALAMINPGNPTGQVNSRGSLETICRFCATNGIVLLADEVYQRNVYAQGKEFISAKKVAVETPGCEQLELVSFHSTSKGLIGECGRRGGYMEMHGVDPYVQSQLYKLASSGLCSGVAGQIMTGLMVRPPQKGDASYDSHAAEEAQIFDSLKRRAKLLVDGLNAIDGIECVPADGAMYAFPRVTVPAGATAHASEQNTTADSLYALSLLDATGICVVPASGFGQAENRVGFRTTFLPSEEELAVAVEKITEHHVAFTKRWAATA